MCMKRYYIRKIKEGKVRRLKEWGKVLSTERLDEVLESLNQENVSREIAYIVKLPDAYYFVGYMESGFKKEIKAADKELKINIDHTEILKECLEPPVIGEEMYDIRLK